MNSMLSYSLAVFVVVLLTGCILNLLKRHFIVQLAGVFFFLFAMVFKIFNMVTDGTALMGETAYFTVLPVFSGIMGCLISMVLGFSVFEPVRKMFKD